jgi:class 3 adenylate cyclase
MMKGKPVPRVCKHEVSIFFANIVGYNRLRGSMDPANLVGTLERLFSKLDTLAEVHGVQRVDVIDGCYIAAANFSADQASDHAVRLARFALDAVAAAGTTLLDEQRPELGAVEILAGMHCGEVCGSVIGAHGGRKYTMHGDAVNVASRMESHGEAGAVQCSAASAARIEEQGGCEGGGLRLEPRDGGVDVKGRGHMAAFWLGCAPRRASSCPLGPTSMSWCTEAAPVYAAR